MSLSRSRTASSALSGPMLGVNNIYVRVLGGVEMVMPDGGEPSRTALMDPHMLVRGWTRAHSPRARGAARQHRLGVGAHRLEGGRRK
jgi:hypothetical protein